MKILRKYKEGSFHYVDVYWNNFSYTRETYTGIYYTWYAKSGSEMYKIPENNQEKIEKEYKEYKKIFRKEKLERILK